MLFSPFVTLVVVLSSVHAGPLREYSHTTFLIPHVQTPGARNLTARFFARQSGAWPVVKVYWNIITVNGEGDVTEERVTKQMGDLNADFQPVGIRFELAASNAIKRVPADDKSWWDQICDNPIELMKQTRNSEAARRDVLSIWTGANCDQTQLARHYESRPDGDGLVIGFGDVSEIGQGPAHALAHEVGHWSGLPHTFQTNSNECGDGDGIDDTPPHVDPTMLRQTRPVGCPAVETCTGEKSDILGSNYMNYVSDECRKSFTPGQIKAMKKALWEFRNIQFPGEFDDQTFSMTPPEADEQRTPNPPWPIEARGTWIYVVDMESKELRPMYDAKLTRDVFDKIDTHHFRKGVVVKLVKFGMGAEPNFIGGDEGWRRLFTDQGLKYNPSPMEHSGSAPSGVTPQKGSFAPSGSYNSLEGVWVVTVIGNTVDRDFIRTMKPDAFDKIVASGHIIGTPKGGGLITKLDDNMIWISESEFRNRYASYDGFDAYWVSYISSYYQIVQ